MGDMVGSVSSISGSGAEYLSVVAIFGGMDPAGTFNKFAQGTKLITRHRMIGVNHGLLLRTYLTQANEPFDKPTEMTEQELLTHTTGNKYKFTRFKSPISIFEFRMYHLILYLVCWLAKFYTFFIISSVSKSLKTNKFQCYFVLYQQRLHFISF